MSFKKWLSDQEAIACVKQGKPAGTTALGYGCGDGPRIGHTERIPRAELLAKSKA